MSASNLTIIVDASVGPRLFGHYCQHRKMRKKEREQKKRRLEKVCYFFPSFSYHSRQKKKSVVPKYFPSLFFSSTFPDAEREPTRAQSASNDRYRRVRCRFCRRRFRHRRLRPFRRRRRSPWRISDTITAHNICVSREVGGDVVLTTTRGQSQMRMKNETAGMVEVVGRRRRRRWKGHGLIRRRLSCG